MFLILIFKRKNFGAEKNHYLSLSKQISIDKLEQYFMIELLFVFSTIYFWLFSSYARPERLDVHLKEQNNVYIHPRNSHKDPDTGKWVLSPEKSIPLINAKGHYLMFFVNRRKI